MEIVISVLSLLPMIISDIRTREVNVLWLIIFGVSQIYFCGTENLIINTFLLLFMLLGVYGYLLIRYGLKSKITNYLGMGDIIFLFSLTTCFEIREFTYFLIVGFAFSILWWLISNEKSIPLVATLGSIYLIWLLIKTL